MPRGTRDLYTAAVKPLPKKMGNGLLALTNLLIPPLGTTLCALKECYEHRERKGAFYYPSVYALPAVWTPTITYGLLLHFNPQYFAFGLPGYLKDIPNLSLDKVGNADEKALGYLLFVVLLPIILKVATKAFIGQHCLTYPHPRAIGKTIGKVAEEYIEQFKDMVDYRIEVEHQKQILGIGSFFSWENWKFGATGINNKPKKNKAADTREPNSAEELVDSQRDIATNPNK